MRRVCASIEETLRRWRRIVRVATEMDTQTLTYIFVGLSFALYIAHSDLVAGGINQ